MTVGWWYMVKGDYGGKFVIFDIVFVFSFFLIFSFISLASSLSLSLSLFIHYLPCQRNIVYWKVVKYFDFFVTSVVGHHEGHRPSQYVVRSDWLFEVLCYKVYICRTTLYILMKVLNLV